MLSPTFCVNKEGVVQAYTPMSMALIKRASDIARSREAQRLAEGVAALTSTTATAASTEVVAAVHDTNQQQQQLPQWAPIDGPGRGGGGRAWRGGGGGGGGRISIRV